MEKSTIARPYAKAVFDLARARGDLPQWSEILGILVTAVQQREVAGMIDDPRVTRERVVRTLLSIGGDRLSAQAQNLVRLLAEKDRLAVLPELRQLYEEMRAEAERTVEAEVVSAQPLTTEQQQKIIDMLRARLKREVDLRVRTDQSLLGGAVIHAGDLVIDGSARGQLARLAATLGQG